MGLFDTFEAPVECPYRKHTVHASFQTKELPDPELRNVKLGQSMSGWGQVPVFGVTKQIAVVSGLGECVKCHEINKRLHLNEGGMPMRFIVHANIVIIDGIFEGVSNVRPDASFIRRLRRIMTVPYPPDNDFTSVEYTLALEHIREINRKLRLRPELLIREILLT